MVAVGPEGRGVISDLRVMSGLAGSELNVRSEREGLGEFPAPLPAETPGCNECQHHECGGLGRVSTCTCVYM